MQLQPETPPPSDAPGETSSPKTHAFAAFLGGCAAMAALFILSERNPSNPASIDIANHAGSMGASEQTPGIGRQLAQTHCGRCHIAPPPSAADRYTWAMSILPKEDAREPDASTNSLAPPPPRPSRTEWRAICEYYLAAAPVTLPPQTNQPPITEGLGRFRAMAPDYPRAAANTFVHIDTKSGTTFVGNLAENRLDVIAPGEGVLGTVRFESVPTSLWETREGMYVTLAGKYRWSDEPLGRLVFLPRPDKPGAQPQALTVAGELHSPSAVLAADFNKDGRDDLLIVEPGLKQGSVSWMEALESGGYKPHVLWNKPGAVRAHVHDIQKDGLPDIFLMTGGHRQGIMLYINRGQGEFLPVTIHSAHPLWGWTDFELADFTGDGHVDIIATNGDNSSADSPYPLKNYHGIRILMNNGQNQFNEVFFFPLHGAAQVVARDFDNDGDLDIAAISYFPDYKRERPLEAFVYLENQGRLKFNAFSMRESLAARWFCMDAADGDGDGDIDIILGAMNGGPGEVPAPLARAWAERPTPLMILVNQTVTGSAPAQPAAKGK